MTHIRNDGTECMRVRFFVVVVVCVCVCVCSVLVQKFIFRYHKS